MKIKMLFLALTMAVVIACNSDDDATFNNNFNENQIAQIAQEGSWRISKFIDSGDDETSDFSGYNFTFKTDGTVDAVNDIRAVSGTWSVTSSSNSSDDDDFNDSDFNLFFPVPETDDFEDLNDDWDFVSINDTKIELIDVSGGNGGTDLLTFERN